MTLLNILLLATLTVPGDSLPDRGPGLVNDFADALPAEMEARMEGQLRALESRSSIEVGVAVVSTLRGYSKEDFAMDLFRKWGMGKAETDNGVLIMWAPNERKYWTAVGYGLEGDLPDLDTKILQDRYWLPKLKEGRGAEGLKDYVDALILNLEPVLHEQKAAVERVRTVEAEKDSAAFWQTAGMVGIVLVTVGLILLLNYRAKRAKREQQRKREVALGEWRRRADIVLAAEQLASDAAKAKHPRAAELAAELDRLPGLETEADLNAMSTLDLEKRAEYMTSEFRPAEAVMRSVQGDMALHAEVKQAYTAVKTFADQAQRTAQRASDQAGKVRAAWPAVRFRWDFSEVDPFLRQAAELRPDELLAPLTAWKLQEAARVARKAMQRLNILEAQAKEPERVLEECVGCVAWLKRAPALANGLIAQAMSTVADLSYHTRQRVESLRCPRVDVDAKDPMKEKVRVEAEIDAIKAVLAAAQSMASAAERARENERARLRAEEEARNRPTVVYDPTPSPSYVVDTSPSSSSFDTGGGDTGGGGSGGDY